VTELKVMMRAIMTVTMKMKMINRKIDLSTL